MSTELSLKVHRIRFFVAELSSINCMSFNESMNKLAIIRRRIRKYKSGQSDTLSTIEIWNFRSKAPFIEQIIDDNSDNPSLLESLVWTPNGRLFSCGLNSYLNEYDLNNSRIKRSYSVRSGPVWTMALDSTNTLIALGTEESYICVFRIEDQMLDFDKVMDRNDSRILSLQWYRPNDNTSQLIISGSIDYIKIWNYQTGRCIDYIKVGNTGIVIWCLAVLEDFTIISGDSSGTTSFWDGKSSTLITSYNSHKADVLCLCVDSDQSTVYCSGVDPIIVQFTKTFNKYNSWVNSTTRRLHTHDVRALTCVKPKWLLSGGIDTYLMRSCYPPNLQLRYLTDFSSKVNIIKDYVFLQYENFVQIWKLGKSDDDVLQSEETIEILPLAERPLKLADIKSRKAIIASAFNDKWIAYANWDNIKLMLWSEDKLEKVALLYEPIVNTSQMVFCGQHYLAVSSGTTLNILKLETLGVILQSRFDFDHRVYALTASDKFLAVCTTDPKRTVTLYDINTWTQTCSFSNNSLPTAFQINPFNKEGELWIAYSNNKLLQYNINNSEIVKSLQISDCIPSENFQTIDEYWTIKQIAFANNSILFSDDNTLYKLDTIENKIKKCDKYRHIIKLGNGHDLNEVIIVELTPEMLFSFLPQALAKKKFGT